MLGKGRCSVFISIFLLQASIGFLLFRGVDSEIPLGSRLSVDEKSRWVSSNGDYAIGFFSRFSQYGVGIRISSGSIPVEEQPVVWVAGADLRVGDRSYFELTKDGDLVLFDSTRGVVVWASETANASVSSAVVQDDGNLVLSNKHNDVVWQSFDTPYDTLLPGQNLSAYQVLRAAGRNSVSSFYSLRVDGSGALRLKWENNVVYWTTPTSPSGLVLRAMLVSDGTLGLFDQLSKPVWSASANDHGDSDVKFRILKLDVDGNLRLYSWAKGSKSWELVWQAVENQCNVFATCGLSGICAFNKSGSPVCQCPFSLTSIPSSKCLLPYQQSCESGSSMVKFDHTSLYAVYPPNETTISQVSWAQCKRLCQEDRLCTAATFANDGTAKCRIKRTRYVSGQLGLSVASVSFVKRCADPLAVVPNQSKSKPVDLSNNTRPRDDGRNKICVSCVVGVGGGTVMVFVVIHLGLTGLWMYRRRNHVATKGSSMYKGERPNPSGVCAFSYDEVKDLTENFKHRMGTKTFKGVLPDGRPVVVKDMGVTTDARKFRCGVLKLGSVHHKNLVRLEGYCCESSHRLMVYEFVNHGSLDKYLEDAEACRRLTWRTRVNLCLAVGRAISYLHMGCREFVGHGRLSCENVVLDENLEAKIKEFGSGSFAGDGGLSERDIRDFGLVVLALVSGDPRGDGGAEWAYEKWVGGQAQEVVDKRMDGGVNGDELERVMRTVFWCLQCDERMRPSMGEIVNVLEGAMAVDSPPPPFGWRNPPDEEEEADEGEV